MSRPKLPPQEGKVCTICKKYKDKTHFGVQGMRLRSLCNPCRQAYTKSHRNLAQSRRYRLKRQYNLTPEEHDVMVQGQQGRCAICSRPCHDWGHSADSFMTDHDHKTQKVRGLLCSNCNRGLGHFQDSPELLHKAATYIEQAA